MRVAIYVRVSTKEQSVSTQLDLCRQHCVRLNHEVFKEYIDIGESGKKESRPAFDEMLKEMRRYRFKGIIVYKMDRLGRSLQHLISLFEEFEKKSVHFTSITQNIDSTTPEGRMFMRMMMILAQYERELTVSRVKAGMLRAKREGKKIGRPKNNINCYEVLRFKNNGDSYRKIANKMNCSLGAVQRCIKKHSGKNG